MDNNKGDRIKEQVGCLKVVFGVFVGGDFAVLGWLAQNFKSEAAMYCLLAIVFINRAAMKKIDELEGL